MTVAEIEKRLASLETQVAHLQEQLERSRISARIRRGLDQADRDQVVPAREALESLRQKYSIFRV